MVSRQRILWTLITSDIDKVSSSSKLEKTRVPILPKTRVWTDRNFRSDIQSLVEVFVPILQDAHPPPCTRLNLPKEILHATSILQPEHLGASRKVCQQCFGYRISRHCFARIEAAIPSWLHIDREMTSQDNNSLDLQYVGFTKQHFYPLVAGALFPHNCHPIPLARYLFN